MSHDQDIAALKQEVAALRAELAEARATSDMKYDSIAKHICSLYELIKSESTNVTEHVTEIYDVLWPVVHHVFPKYGAGIREVKAFLARIEADDRRKS